jgi:hypothetical protein
MNEILEDENITMNQNNDLNPDPINNQQDPLNYRNSYLYLESKCMIEQNSNKISSLIDKIKNDKNLKLKNR